MLFLIINDLPISPKFGSYVDGTNIYFCLDSNYDRYDKVKLAAGLENYSNQVLTGE